MTRHRPPGTGLALAALPMNGVFVELIADGIHVHPGALATDRAA